MAKDRLHLLGLSMSSWRHFQPYTINGTLIDVRQIDLCSIRGDKVITDIYHPKSKIFFLIKMMATFGDECSMNDNFYNRIIVTDGDKWKPAVYNDLNANLHSLDFPRSAPLILSRSHQSIINQAIKSFVDVALNA